MAKWSEKFFTGGLPLYFLSEKGDHCLSVSTEKSVTMLAKLADTRPRSSVDPFLVTGSILVCVCLCC